MVTEPQPLAQTTRVYRFGGVCVDLHTSTVERGGTRVELGATERRLLGYFLANVGRAVSREELLEHVWGYAPSISSRTIDVHVAKLRRKLEASANCPAHLLTVHGLGYKFIG
jgi:two-component system alkaline phosphatase synthesis response regulator PhoP